MIRYSQNPSDPRAWPDDAPEETIVDTRELRRHVRDLHAEDVRAYFAGVLTGPQVNERLALATHFWLVDFHDSLHREPHP